MTQLRRETARFKRHALNSLITAIELFNRPRRASRTEGVLFFLQHAFEMLLKAAIYQERRTIHEPKSSVTYRFDKCLAIARSDLGILSQDEADSLSILDGCRDCAMHYHIEMSEESLYLHAQAAVTIFNDLLNRAFGERIADYLPERILPISTRPPEEIQLFMDSEFSQIRNLIAPGRRRRAEAKARIRPYLIMESVLQGSSDQPSDVRASRVIKRIQTGEDWQAIFPGVSTLTLDTTDHGFTFSVRFARQQNAPPVRIVQNGEHVEDVTLVREVNMLDRYSMGLFGLADKAGLGRNKTLALVHYLGLQSDPECFREFRVGVMNYKRYSQKALEKIREALPGLDLDRIWRDYSISRSRRSRT